MIHNTRYFADKVKETGRVPVLNAEQFSRMMNIIFLEAQVQALRLTKVKADYQTSHRERFEEVEDKLILLLKGKQPRELYQEMLDLSAAHPDPVEEQKSPE